MLAARDRSHPGGGWERFDGTTLMHFSESAGMAAVPRREHLSFWDAYYERRRRAAAEEGDDG